MELELKNNWFALIVSVLCECSPEIALSRMGFNQLYGGYKKRSKEDIEEIIKLRIEGLSNRQIGELLLINPTRVSQIYNKWLKEQNKESSEDRK